MFCRQGKPLERQLGEMVCPPSFQSYWGWANWKTKCKRWFDTDGKEHSQKTYGYWMKTSGHSDTSCQLVREAPEPHHPPPLNWKGYCYCCWLYAKTRLWALLLKILHAHALTPGHKEMKLGLNRKLPPWWLAFIMLEAAMPSARRTLLPTFLLGLWKLRAKIPHARQEVPACAIMT